jgi:hypothetical protein
VIVAVRTGFDQRLKPPTMAALAATDAYHLSTNGPAKRRTLPSTFFLCIFVSVADLSTYLQGDS